jgi:hypothetical protein
MIHRKRSEKIENIYMALGMLEKDAGREKFEMDMTLTSLIGPNIALKTSHYEAVITVPFEGQIVILEINGAKQRFADYSAFLEFFLRSLEHARPATLTLAAVMPDSVRLGNSVTFERNGVRYVCAEKDGQFEVRYNNQTMVMTHDDIAAVFG